MPVINPIGTAIILLGMTDGATVDTRKAIARRVALNTVILLAIILLGGKYLLQLFGISVPIVQVAGGLVLSSMGWGLLNQKPAASEVKSEGGTRSQESYLSQAFYPFTFPITVGPGSVAVALTLSAHTSHGAAIDGYFVQIGSLVGIAAMAVVVYFCLAYADKLVSRIGPSGVSVMARLIAFIVVCIGAEITWSGVKTLMEK